MIAIPQQKLWLPKFNFANRRRDPDTNQRIRKHGGRVKTAEPCCCELTCDEFPDCLPASALLTISGLQAVTEDGGDCDIPGCVFESVDFSWDALNGGWGLDHVGGGTYELVFAANCGAIDPENTPILINRVICGGSLTRCVIRRIAATLQCNEETNKIFLAGISVSACGCANSGSGWSCSSSSSGGCPPANCNSEILAVTSVCDGTASRSIEWDTAFPSTGGDCINVIANNCSGATSSGVAALSFS